MAYTTNADPRKGRYDKFRVGGGADNEPYATLQAPQNQVVLRRVLELLDGGRGLVVERRLPQVRR